MQFSFHLPQGRREGSGRPSERVRRAIVNAAGGLVIGGAAMWFIAPALAPGVGAVLAERLRDSAVVLVLTALITGVMEWLAIGHLVDSVDELFHKLDRTSAAQTRELAAAINQIVENAEAAGLTQIHLDRNDSTATAAIAKALKESTKEVRIIGIALPAFFNPQGPFYKGMRTLLDEKVPIRVLMLKSDCAAAEERSDIEEEHDTVENIRWSLQRVLRWMSKGATISCRLYTARPSIFALITEHVLIFEVYHCGRTPGLERGECIGGRVPILAFKAGSPMYAAISAHFEHVWTRASEDAATGAASVLRPVA